MDVTRVPTLIFQEELTRGPFGSSMTADADGPGVLACSSASGTGDIIWRYTDRMISASGAMNNIIVRIGTMRSQMLQNANAPLPAGGRNDVPFLNGLWSCTQDETRLYVGIYDRLPGKLSVAKYA